MSGTFCRGAFQAKENVDFEAIRAKESIAEDGGDRALMAKDNRGDFYPVPVVDQGTRPGAVTRLILFILVLTVTAVLFGIFRERLGDPFLLGMLGVLAMTGVGFLFAAAIGFVQIASRSTTDELSKSFINSMAQGLVVTDSKGRIVYANQAYAEMTGATSASDLRTVETLLSDVPEAADAIYRLASGLRDGQPGTGEFRMTRSLKGGANGGPRWYRVQARTSRYPVSGNFSRPGRSPIFRRACRTGALFPGYSGSHRSSRPRAGGLFLSRSDGRIIYINATLAEWLGVDLAVSPRRLMVRDIVAGNGMALINAVKTEPGTSRNTVIDLDLAKSNGQACRAFLHRVQRNGMARRTNPHHRSEPRKAKTILPRCGLGVRFTRFFNSTPWRSQPSMRGRSAHQCAVPGAFRPGCRS